MGAYIKNTTIKTNFFTLLVKFNILFDDILVFDALIYSALMQLMRQYLSSTSTEKVYLFMLNSPDVKGYEEALHSETIHVGVTTTHFTQLFIRSFTHINNHTSIITMLNT